MKTVLFSIIALCLLSEFANAGQIVAGTTEDKMFQQITADTNPDSKLQELMEFEKQFPQSKALPNVYLMTIDLYRQKGDRAKIIEYGEKILKFDQGNVTAMMVLARNFAIEGKNLDRAVELAQQAVDRIGKMRTEAVPPQYTDTQWKDYLQNTEAAAQSILGYAKSIKGNRPSS